MTERFCRTPMAESGLFNSQRKVKAVKRFLNLCGLAASLGAATAAG